MTESEQQSSEGSTRFFLFCLVLGLFWFHQLALPLWEAQAISWLPVGGGIFIVTLPYSKTVANSRPAQHIGEWQQQFSETVQGLGILLLFAVVVGGSIWLFIDSFDLLKNFIVGMLLCSNVQLLRILVRRGFSN